MKVRRLIALVLFVVLIFLLVNNLCGSIIGIENAWLIFFVLCVTSGIMLYLRLSHPIQLYTFSLKFFPWAAILYNNRGTAYMVRGNYEQGLKDLGRAIELKPDRALAYYNRGSTYQRMGKVQQAIEDFNAALQLKPKWLLPYQNRATTYVFRGDYLRAIQDYNQILALQPRFVASLLGRAVAYGKLKDFQRALEDCEAASQLIPHSIAAYSTRGGIYLLAHDYQRAIADYDKALTCTRSGAPWYANRYTGNFKADVYIGRSLAYTGLRNYQQALQDGNEAIALAPQLADAYRVRGRAYLGLKELQRAQADFARACELFPDSSLYGLLLVWTEMCMTGPNAERAERLLAIAQGDLLHHAASICEGVAFWLRGQFADAAQAIEPAIASAPQEWEVTFWTGIIYASLGKDEEAVSALRDSITQGLPSVLLTPLTWLKQQRPAFYERYAAELLGNNENHS